MVCPCVQRGALVLRPFEALVDPYDTAATARDVVKHRFSAFKPHPKALEPCGESPPQIMYASAGYA